MLLSNLLIQDVGERVIVLTRCRIATSRPKMARSDVRLSRASSVWIVCHFFPEEATDEQICSRARRDSLVRVCSVSGRWSVERSRFVTGSPF